MQLSASMFLGDSNPDEVLYEREAKVDPSLPTSDVETRQIIAFKPRWECPVLDFSNANPTESYVSETSQKACGISDGEIPSADNGIFLKIEPGTNAGNKDLAQLLNINSKQKSKLGKLNSSEPSAAPQFADFNKKQFSEAIIAIPFKFDKSLKQTELFCDKRQIDLIKKNLYKDEGARFDALSPYNVRTFEEIDLLTTTNIQKQLNGESKALYDLMMLMRKYVIPPHLDFLHNDKINPFVMFMMDIQSTYQRRIYRTFGKMLNLHLHAEP